MYALKEAFKSMLRNRYMTLVSIVTISVTLIVLGVFSILTFSANELIQNLRRNEEINVYLDEDLPDEDMLALDSVVALMSEVEETRILSKEDAAAEFEAIYGSDLFDALEVNPLPRTIVVVMKQGHRMSSDLKTVADRISKATGVESVEYGGEWMSKLDLFFLIFIIGEFTLSLLIISACLLIISNTITITVIARKETVEIMRLVGATDAFIRKPFYFEGIFQGFISGVIAFLVIYGIYLWIGYAVPNFEAYLYMLSIPIVGFVMFEIIIAMIIPMGAILGMIGSYFAVRRAF